jgi:hypothetical protein
MQISNTLSTLILLITTVLPGLLWIDRQWRENSYALQGKNVLITRGSRRLGLVMARQGVHSEFVPGQRLSTEICRSM